VPVDQFGFLDRSSFPERVVAQDWRMLVDYTVQTILSSLTLDARRAVHAIYLRGSVASGYAIPGESDIDFAIYVDPPFVETLKEKRICTSQAVCSRFKDVVRVDYRVYPFKLRAIPSPAQSLSELSGALVIQAFGICVYGYDFLADSPACRVDCHLAVDIMRDKRVAVEEARRLGSCGDTRGELRVLQWFLKRAIRALAELHSIKSGRFARDLVPCVRIRLIRSLDTWK
jgi:Nucleotidyltransferase domain